MDDSLVSLMNNDESNDINNENYYIDLNLTNNEREKVSIMGYSTGIVLNLISISILTSSIIGASIIYILSLVSTIIGFGLLYKNNKIIEEYAILFGLYLISIFFEFILIFQYKKTNSNFSVLIFSYIYQIMYSIYYYYKSVYE